MSPRPVVQHVHSQLRARILDAFEERARQAGPRAVVMAELARDLGISTRTLYQVFPSKADLVLAIMEAWAAEVEADQIRRRTSALTVKERMADAAESWVIGQERFSRTFWAQIRRDFPDAAQVLGKQVRKSMAIAREMVVGQIAPDLNADLCLALLLGAIRQAASPDLCNALGISRREAVEGAIELWSRGAMAPSDRRGP